MKMEETVALIKSCIISKKRDVPIEDLNDEFQNLVGESISYRRLGFSSLRAFSQTIDTLEITWNEFGEQTLKINDSKISHIDRFIRKRKVNYSKTRNKYYKRFMHNKGNLRYNNNERREKNRLIYNTNRANKRSQDLAHRRDLNLFGNKENHHPVVMETNEVKRNDRIYNEQTVMLQTVNNYLAMISPYIQYEDFIFLYTRIA